jgi:hypothetical protein
MGPGDQITQAQGIGNPLRVLLRFGSQRLFEVPQGGSRGVLHVAVGGGTRRVGRLHQIVDEARGVATCVTHGGRHMVAISEQAGSDQLPESTGCAGQEDDLAHVQLSWLAK